MLRIFSSRTLQTKLPPHPSKKNLYEALHSHSFLELLSQLVTLAHLNDASYTAYLESDAAAYPYVDDWQYNISDVDKYLADYLRDLVVRVVMETFVDVAPT